MSERWKSCPGFPTYEVSDHGRVRRGLRVLSLPTCRRYQQVVLYSGGRVFRKNVHVLVAAAFLGPRPRGAVVDHKDHDKSDNRVVNLQYITQKANLRRARAAGLADPVAAGRRGGLANAGVGKKLCGPLVDVIRSMRERGYPLRDIAAAFSIHPATVSKIVSRKLWNSRGRVDSTGSVRLR